MHLPEHRPCQRRTLGMTLAAFLILAACSDVGSNSDNHHATDGSGDRGAGSLSHIAGTARQAGDSANVVIARQSPAGTEGFVVIRSMGPSAGGLATGTRLAGDAVVTLAAGDRLVVTDGTQTRTLSGPGRFDLGSATPATGNSIDTAQDFVAAQIEGDGRSAAAATRRTIGPPGGGGPRQPPALSNGAVVQVQVSPAGTIAPRPRGPLIDGPRVVRPRIDQMAPRLESGTIAAAPPAPDAPVAARMPSPAVAARQRSPQ